MEGGYRPVLVGGFITDTRLLVLGGRSWNCFIVSSFHHKTLKLLIICIPHSLPHSLSLTSVYQSVTASLLSTSPVQSVPLISRSSVLL
jgi:hypothetical protein